jgi:DNA-binding response OmpR family regulator
VPLGSGITRGWNVARRAALEAGEERGMTRCTYNIMESELTDATDACRGRKVLLVEDSPVISEATEMMLSDMGCEVIGPAGTMAPALQWASEAPLDAAVVDINIRGGKAFSILTILKERNIPFLLTSGYADWSMPEEWRGRPRLAKPYGEGELRDAMAALLGGAKAGSGTA